MGKIIENYSLQHQLGTGVYSKVFKAVNLKTNQEVAIKMIKAETFKKHLKLEEGTVNEINILTNLEPCQHIIRYYDMLKTVNNFYFVYEFCNGGTFEGLLKKEGALPEKVALGYFAQLLEAFKILNKNNVMHRDLKPDNILIHDGILKLADFGFCKPLENEQDTTKTMLGSPIYMAPEILNGKTYTIKADIWSLGVVLFRMLYGYCPFESGNIGQLIMAIDKEDLKIPFQPYVSEKLVKLLKRMLTKDPNQRIDWAEIFSYEIKNGEIFGSGIYDKSKKMTDSGMKSSEAPTLDSSTKGSNIDSVQNIPFSAREFGKGRVEEKSVTQNQTSGSGIERPYRTQLRPEFMHNPRNQELRATYTAKNPLRENIKKQMMLKNHSKCIDLASLISLLCRYECAQSLILAYIFAVNVDRELTGILESIRKQGDPRMLEDVFMKEFYYMAEVELNEIRNNIEMFQQEIQLVMGIGLEGIQGKRRHIMKKFVSSLRFQSINELVMASRVIDLLQEGIFIRKQTYQNMTKDQLTKKIRDKIQTINDF